MNPSIISSCLKAIKVMNLMSIWVFYHYLFLIIFLDFYVSILLEYVCYYYWFDFHFYHAFVNKSKSPSSYVDWVRIYENKIHSYYLVALSSLEPILDTSYAVIYLFHSYIFVIPSLCLWIVHWLLNHLGYQLLFYLLI